MPAGHTISLYRCRSKADVYNAFSRIKSEGFKKERVLFFVDKDLSDFLIETWPVDSNIFVTRWYSIENYIVNAKMVEKISRQIIHVYDEKKLDAIRKIFDQQYSQFVREMSHVMSWILLARQLQLRPNLQNISLNNLYVIDSSFRFSRRTGITIQSLIRYLQRSTQCNIPSTQLKQRARLRKMLVDGSEPKKFIRGKFDLWFLVSFLEIIKRTYTQTRRSGEQKPGNLPSLIDALNVFGPRVSSIPELTEFIQSNWLGLHPPPSNDLAQH